ncbi:metal ABC transporter ATP-binding protein [Frankia sp. CiP3]|uniref:metal ABC transporter ATP-binding protein n=1 Tax=Frankia sp. CiP3 TaxID=2880971 RepID=UPI001EF565DC|nr:ATP-binding cassette domain-containing protein [Frankia sp. CiP3]
MAEVTRGLSGDSYNVPNIASITDASGPPGASIAAAAGPAVLFERVTIAAGRTPVLTDVHGTVETGHAVAIIGPRHGGKSALLQSILGLAPVLKGSVTVLGQPPGQARRQVAYIPPADSFDGKTRVTVIQVVLMGRYRWIGWVRRPTLADRTAAARALARVGLADRSRDCFETLSGTQRQRVMLARAMAQQPRILLLDEPLTEVDVPSQAALLATLATMRSAGASVVISTDDLALAHLACDDVFLFNHRQVAFGPTTTVLTQQALDTAFGGSTGSTLESLRDATIMTQYR